METLPVEFTSASDVAEFPDSSSNWRGSPPDGDIGWCIISARARRLTLRGDGL